MSKGKEPQFTERADGLLIIAIGSSRCGKSSFAWEQIKESVRLVVFDPQGQIGLLSSKFHCVDSLDEARDVMKKHQTGDCWIAVQHMFSKQEFSAVCRLVYAWGVCEPCTFYVDEVGIVTSPSHAPYGWQLLCSAILKYGVNIVAVTQRPQRLDKDSLDNSTHLALFRLGDEARKAVAALGLPLDKVPGDKYHYNVRDPEGDWSGPQITKEL